MKTRAEYVALRKKHIPDHVKLIIVAESPPASGKYFYDPSGAVSEPLFAALMKQLGSAPLTKEEGLRHFQKKGWVLVDATYEPVNDYVGSKRKATILRDYKQLRADLLELSPTRSLPIVVIKTSLWRLIAKKLQNDGFPLQNTGAICFPSHGWQREFHRQFNEAVQRQ